MALKLSGKSDWTTLYEKLHDIDGRATFVKMMNNRLPLELYRLYNSETWHGDWVDVSVQQYLVTEQDSKSIT